MQLRRTVLGLTQAELSSISGVPQSHISAFENGKRRISSGEEAALTKAVSVHTHNLMGLKRRVVRNIFMKYGYEDIFLFGPVATGQDDARTPVHFLVSSSNPLGVIGLFELQNELEMALSVPVFLFFESGRGNPNVDRFPREVHSSTDEEVPDPLLVDLYRNGDTFSPRELEGYSYYVEHGFWKTLRPYDPEDAKLRLEDMVNALDFASRLVKSESGKFMNQDLGAQKARYAGVSIILQVLAAAHKLHSRVKEQNPEIPWAAMSGLFTGVFRFYDEIDGLVVQATLENDLPKLREQLKSISLP